MGVVPQQQRICATGTPPARAFACVFGRLGTWASPLVVEHRPAVLADRIRVVGDLVRRPIEPREVGHERQQTAHLTCSKMNPPCMPTIGSMLLLRAPLHLRRGVAPAAAASAATASITAATTASAFVRRRHLASAATPPPPETPAACIARVHAVMLDGQAACFDTFEPSIGDDGILLLDLGEKGQYSLQPHEHDKLMLFSPLVGPKIYSFDESNRWWSAVDDGHLMDELLVRELMHITSVCLNL